MKKLLVLCLLLVFVLTSCGKNTQDKGNNPSASDNSSVQSETENLNDDSNTQSDAEDLQDSSNEENSGEFTEDLEFEEDFGFEDSFAELNVDTNVIKPVLNQTRPADNSADILNPAIVKKAGANKQANAMRKSILASKDAISVKGTTYYVSQNGDDTNDGKSPKTPFATLNTAFGNAKAGDAVLIERGSIYRLVNTVTLENGVTYGAYGEGPKPEIWGSIENYADSSLWSPYSIRNVWSISFVGSDVGIIVFNHGELAGNMEYYVRNLKKNGDFFFDDVQKVLYVYCDKGNPGKVYDDIEIGSRKILFRLRNGAQNVTIDNISFRYTGNFGIHGSMGCKNINITNCIVGWVGGSLFADGSNRYGNGIEFTGGCENLTVENCWIYQVYDAGFTFQITIPDSTIEERTYRNIKVKNNLLEYCSWAFEWWPSEGDCVIENIVVEGNIMRFSGYGWAWDTRIPSHVRGSWSAKDFDIKNFMISKNIFDCSNGPVYAWTLYEEGQFANSFLGNQYYQRKPESAKMNVFEFEFEENTSGKYKATNQAEFEKVVKAVDSKATLIKWLG